MIELLPRLRRFSYALTGNLDEADDLVQEACTRALSSADQWQTGTRLDSWMYRIAQNVWFDKLRAAKVRGESVDVDTALDLVGSDGRDVTESQLTLRAVSKSISQLPAEQQLVIAHVCIDGQSYKEAADALGIPIGTVMSRLARARQALHAVMTAETNTASRLAPAHAIKEAGL
jgi:RNA polymerase sigma-70 factor, ECF subfamily